MVSYFKIEECFLSFLRIHRYQEHVERGAICYFESIRILERNEENNNWKIHLGEIEGLFLLMIKYQNKSSLIFYLIEIKKLSQR